MYYLIDSNINECYLYNNIKIGVSQEYEWYKCSHFFTDPKKQSWAFEYEIDKKPDINLLSNDIILFILNIIQSNDYILYVITSEYEHHFEHKYCFIYGNYKPNTPVKCTSLYSLLNIFKILQFNEKITNLDNKVSLLEKRISELLTLLYQNCV